MICFAVLFSTGILQTGLIKIFEFLSESASDFVSEIESVFNSSLLIWLTISAKILTATSCGNLALMSIPAGF